MSYVRDPLALWGIGLLGLVVAALGAIAAGAIVWVPLALVYAALGYPQENVFTALAYTAVIWLPLGYGAGMATVSRFMKGYRSKAPRKNKCLTDLNVRFQWVAVFRYSKVL